MSKTKDWVELTRKRVAILDNVQLGIESGNTAKARKMLAAIMRDDPYLPYRERWAALSLAAQAELPGLEEKP